MADKLVIRPMVEGDLAAADRINRLAFGKFFGLAEPLDFRGDASPIGARWQTERAGKLVALRDGRLVGSGLTMRWGTLVLLGPLTVDPACWGQGIARALMAALVDGIDRGGATLAGLFTHPQSPTHIRLYEAFGFRMQRITAVMSKAVEALDPPPGTRLMSSLDGAGRARARAGCRRVAETHHGGLDLGAEIDFVLDRRKGDVVLLDAAGGEIAGFALCHHGAGSEAGSGMLLVKFAALAAGTATPGGFARLLVACEALAARSGAPRGL